MEFWISTKYVSNQCIHWVLKMKVECRCNIVFCENLVLIMSPDPYFTSFLFSGFHAAVGKPVFHEINMILVLFCSPSLLFCVDENILWEKCIRDNSTGKEKIFRVWVLLKEKMPS